MSYKRWIIPEISKTEINALAEECGTDPFLTLLSFCRGYNDPFSLDMFLSKELPDLDPYAFLDMEIAVQRVLSAIEKGEKITIFGDYDCDGTTATALMYNFLKSLDADVNFYIPSRKEGYGMNLEAVEKIAEGGTKLIITVDNGIAANKEIERANELSVDTIVTDHHLPQGELPNAIAVIDPHIEDHDLDFKDYAGVGVAFMLALAISGLSPEVMLSKYGDLVALGTVADLMPLKYENRGLVAAGIRKFNISPNKGLKELIISSGVSVGNISSVNLGFSIAPRINAAGRLGDASRAVRLLITEDIYEMQRIANELCSENSKRQEIEKEITSLAANIINDKKLFNNRVIVVMGENWHEGVLGIAAGRLAEQFARPVVLLTKYENEGIAKGSARSVSNFKLFDAISSVGETLVKFGGHDMAAVVTVEIDRVEEFSKAINEYAKIKEYPIPELFIDMKLNPSAISLDLAEVLKELEPFGTKNPNPVFGLFGMKLVRIISMAGGKHIRLILAKNDTTVAAVMFGMPQSDFPFAEGEFLDLAVTLQTSFYQGEEQINVLVKDVKIHGHNDKKVFDSLIEYEEFLSGKMSTQTISKLYFEREEMGEIYKDIKSGKNSLGALMYYIKKMPFSKIAVILDVMEELGLISTFGNGLERKITLNETSKVSLENSNIYLKLKALAVEV